MGNVVAALFGLLVFVTGAFSALACESGEVPPGAETLGYKTPLIVFCPKKSDIALDGVGNTSALYPGAFWSPKLPDPSLFSDAEDGTLVIALPAGVSSAPRNMKPGKIPLLSGEKGFYIEFEARISDNDNDHWPALWLLPIEHNFRNEDSYPPDPGSFQRFQEIDVEEGGFSPGPMGTAIAWSGVFPNYKRVRSNPNLHNAPIDRTLRHRYAVGFDPRNLTMSFWFDDKLQYTAKSPAVSEVARKQNFYFFTNAQGHAKQKPYTLNVIRIRAFAP